MARPKIVKAIPFTARAEIAKNLQRALDGIENGADDRTSFREVVRLQRDALKLSHRCFAKLGGEA